MLDAIDEFLATVREEQEPDRILTTVLHTRVASGDAAPYAALVRNQLPRFRGEPLGEAGARFDGPARAVRCARALVAAAAARGLDVRAGLHSGEIAITNGDATGPAIDVSAEVAAAAGPGEVLASSTVRDLVAGSGIAFQRARRAARVRAVRALLRRHPRLPDGYPAVTGPTLLRSH